MKEIELIINLSNDYSSFFLCIKEIGFALMQ